MKNQHMHVFLPIKINECCVMSCPDKQLNSSVNLIEISSLLQFYW